MNIISILEGIEKLVVELLLWLILIPKTLFKIISDPNWVSKYVDEELEKKSEKFVNFISPIMLFLVSSVVLFFIFDHIDFEGTEAMNAEKLLKDLKGTAGLLAGLGFLSLPLLFGLATEYFRKTKLTQQGIQRILYIQCYYFSPMILSILVLSLFGSLLPDDEIVITIFSFFILIGILIWFLIVEVKLIASELQSGMFKSIGVFIGTGLIFLLGFSFLIFASESGEIDNFDAGETEKIQDIALPYTGEYSIVISDFNYAAGKYRLTLDDTSIVDISGDQYLFNKEDVLLGGGYISFGQYTDGKVSKGDSSIWIFEGFAGDNISITVKPHNKMDVVFDVQDEQGKTILKADNTNYIMFLGYFYILIIGWAVVRGFRSMIRKPQKTDAAGENKQTEE